MDYIVSSKVRIQQKFNPISFALAKKKYAEMSREEAEFCLLGINPTVVYIKEKPYNVIDVSRAYRTRGKDGYFHYVYIQINYDTHEYYVGKVNRKRLSEFRNYQGSGLKFVAKYKKNPNSFVRFYIAQCMTKEETEEIEKSIVDSELLSDPFCLNLVEGGGGTTNHDSEERKEKIRQYMIEHPENYGSMIEASKKRFQSGQTYMLQARNKAIKEAMSDEFHRKQSYERFKKWRENDPEGYAASRENSKRTIQSDEYRAKRSEMFREWATANPEEYIEMQKKMEKGRNTPEARQKRKDSLKRWAENNPEQAANNARKRAEASAKKSSKPVEMFDLETQETIRRFNSRVEAAHWLVDNGYTKTLNCKTSISSVCLSYLDDTRIKKRYKAFGYGWRFSKL